MIRYWKLSWRIAMSSLFQIVLQLLLALVHMDQDVNRPGIMLQRLECWCLWCQMVDWTFNLPFTNVKGSHSAQGQVMSKQFYGSVITSREHRIRDLSCFWLSKTRTWLLCWCRLCWTMEGWELKWPCMCEDSEVHHWLGFLDFTAFQICARRSVHALASQSSKTYSWSTNAWSCIRCPISWSWVKACKCCNPQSVPLLLVYLHSYFSIIFNFWANWFHY